MDLESGNLKITLRLHPTTVEALQALNGLIPTGELADMARYCMYRGMEALSKEAGMYRGMKAPFQEAGIQREGETEPGKVASNRGGEMSQDEFTKLHRALQKAGKEPSEEAIKAFYEHLKANGIKLSRRSESLAKLVPPLFGLGPDMGGPKKNPA